MAEGLRWPTPDRYHTSQGFGQTSLGIEPTLYLAIDANGKPRRARRNAFQGAKKFSHVHPGVDVACPIGTEVRAPADGKIVGAGVYSQTGEKYLMLRIRRTDESQTVLFFTHLSRVVVQIGERVERSNLIALTGNSGWSTGPHLHWEVRQGAASDDAWMSTASGLWYRHNPTRLQVGGDLAGLALIRAA